MDYKLVPFEPGMEADFYGLHCPANEAGWCYCVAWWVESWDGWAERTAEQNKQFRQTLLSQNQYDGFLIYDGQQPIGWCQVGPRDRLVKLVHQMGLDSDPAVWAVTCFLVARDYRRQGVAGKMLEMVLTDLKEDGIQFVEAYPKLGIDLDAADLWNGPEALFRKAGFEFLKETAGRAVWRKRL